MPFQHVKFDLTERPSALFLLGPCALFPVVDAVARQGVRADHLVMTVDDARRTAFSGDWRQALTGDYAANVVTFPLRGVYAEGALRMTGERNDLLWPRLTGEVEAQTYFDCCVDALQEFMLGLRDLFEARATFVLSLWEPRRNFVGLTLPVYDLRNPAFFVRRLNEALAGLCAGFPHAVFVDVNEVLNNLGRYRIQDDYVRELSHASNMFDSDFEDDRQRIQPSTSIVDMYDTADFAFRFGDEVADRILDGCGVLSGRETIKLVIVDLDDTLWRGVAAETERSEFERLDHWPLGLAEALLIYKARGGLLAICSKNDLAFVEAEFERLWRGRLKLDDFVSVKVNRRPKSENIAYILSETNLLPDAALFIDDNPREIAEVRGVFPEINTLSAEHHDWRRALLLSPRLQVARLSDEGARRTALVRSKIEREASSAGSDREPWLHSLHLRQSYALITTPGHPQFARGFELLNKTNQFNTTGRRWTRDELAGYFRSGGEMITASLRDDTTDNGLIGLALAQGDCIHQVVLSCRVFGLCSEQALGVAVCRRILRTHAQVRADFQSTGRNFACSSYFHQLGFREIGGGLVLVDGLIDYPEVIASENLQLLTDGASQPELETTT